MRDGIGYRRLEPSEHTLAVGLPQWHQADAGGDEVRSDRMKIGREGRHDRDAVAPSRNADRDRISARNGANRDEPIERGAWPRCARHLEEGTALRRRLEVALSRRRNRRGELGDCGKGLIVGSRRSAMGMDQ